MNVDIDMQPQISIKIRPNNQITITSGNFRKKLPEVSQSLQKDLDKVDRKEIFNTAEEMAAHRAMYRTLVDVTKNKRSAPLDLIKKSQRSPKPFALVQQKPKSFTRHSGQKLRECGAAMAIASSGRHERCREVTLTLPANHDQAFDVLAKASGYAINRLLEPIRKEFGKDALWFFVWEYQKRGALHLHFAIYHEEEKRCEEMAQLMIKQWHKILCDLSDKTGICMFSRKNKKSCTIKSNHQYHTAPMKKEVSRYFAKYAGKEESKNNWYCQKYPVSRFWGSSRSIKNIIKANSFECSWDYFSNENEQSKKFEMIIQNILEKLNIVSVSSYSFAVSLKGKHRINHYKDGKKVISFGKDLCVASGERFCIYCDSKDFQKAIQLCIWESESF